MLLVFISLVTKGQNFRFDQTERICKQQLECSSIGDFLQIILWEKEKMLGTSINSFSQNVFKRSIPQGFENKALFGKGLNH